MKSETIKIENPSPKLLELVRKLRTKQAKKLIEIIETWRIEETNR